MTKTYTIKNLIEKPKYDYVYFHPDRYGTEQMILSVPVVGGKGVSLDNTCQTFVAQDGFFIGRGGHTSAEAILRSMMSDLRYDIRVLRTAGHTNSYAVREKERRLAQVQQYTNDLQAMRRSHRFRNLFSQHSGYKHLAATSLELIRDSRNAHTCLLAPTYPDSVTRFNHYKTTFANNNSPYTFGSMLRNAFRGGIAVGSPKGSNVKATIVTNIIKSLRGKKIQCDQAGLDAIIEAARRCIKDELKLDDKDVPAFDKAVDRDFNLSYMTDILCVETFDDAGGFDKYIEIVLNATIKDTYWTHYQPLNVFYDREVYNDSRNTYNKIAMAVQFFIANANAYARSHNYSNLDFGRVIERSGTSSTFSAFGYGSSSSVDHKRAIVDLVTSTLRSGNSVPEAILNYINTNRASFGMASQFSQADMNAISRKFNVDFNTIKNCESEGGHFDEYLMLLPDVDGDLYVHDGNISYPLSRLIQREMSSHYSQHHRDINALVQTPRFRSACENNEIPTDRTKQNLHISLSTSNIQQLIRQIDSGENSPVKFARFLLSEMESGNRLFEELEPELIHTIMSSPYWNQISQAFRTECSRSSSSGGLNDKFQTTFSRDNISYSIRLNHDSVEHLRPIARTRSRFTSLSRVPESGEVNSTLLQSIFRALRIEATRISHNARENYFEVNLNRRQLANLRMAERQGLTTIRTPLDNAAVSALVHAALTKKHPSIHISEGEDNGSKLAKALTILGHGHFEFYESLSNSGFNSVVPHQSTHFTRTYDVRTTTKVQSDILREIESYRHTLTQENIDAIRTQHNYFNPRQTHSDLNEMIRTLNIQLLSEPVREAHTGNYTVYATPEQMQIINAIDIDEYRVPEYNHSITLDFTRQFLNGVHAMTIDDSSKNVEHFRQNIREGRLNFALSNAIHMMGINFKNIGEFDERTNSFPIECTEKEWSAIQSTLSIFPEQEKPMDIPAPRKTQVNRDDIPARVIEEPAQTTTRLREPRNTNRSAQEIERVNYTFPARPRRNVFARFFRAIYFFFYELFHWCKRLSFNAINRARRRPHMDEQTEVNRSSMLIASLCNPSATNVYTTPCNNYFRPAITVRSSQPFMDRSQRDILNIRFDSTHGGHDRYYKAKNLTYTLSRERIAAQHQHFNGSDIVRIEGRRNQNLFFQKLYNCDSQEAERHLHDLRQTATVSSY